MERFDNSRNKDPIVEKEDEWEIAVCEKCHKLRAYPVMQWCSCIKAKTMFKMIKTVARGRKRVLCKIDQKEHYDERCEGCIYYEECLHEK